MFDESGDADGGEIEEETIGGGVEHEGAEEEAAAAVEKGGRGNWCGLRVGQGGDIVGDEGLKEFESVWAGELN